MLTIEAWLPADLYSLVCLNGEAGGIKGPIIDRCSGETGEVIVLYLTPVTSYLIPWILLANHTYTNLLSTSPIPLIQYSEYPLLLGLPFVFN